MLPFTHAEFLAVFGRYNTSVWPAQVAAYFLGFVIAWSLIGASAAFALAMPADWILLPAVLSVVPLWRARGAGGQGLKPVPGARG